MTVADAVAAARRIRLAVFDVDGVLTDGKLFYGADGGEYKAFHVRDGLGIKLLQRAGMQVAIITGRNSPSVTRRATELGINHLIQGREDKLEALRELLATHFPEWGEDLAGVAYMGDDLPDLAAICAVGLGMTVADACPAVLDKARWRTTRPGGAGAAREAAEFILRAQQRFDLLLEAPP
ncbi:MAG: HAD-IIIA family hydrolase [Gammaproteobacteria bacterium]|nr:HAD-IIIA family hydrolase [Gammaproteobacteria bacterium]MBK8132998.1 HAD-IIIA family hydrolase [Gammaproteobacteria bacterium]MBK9428784.1 HAD-IIIA family hydrolase [Gammaproteobacteria bacterium]